MPDYEINFYLANGARATVKMEDTSLSAQEIDSAVQTQMNKPDNDLHLGNNSVVVRLRKNEIVGYTVDKL